MANMVNEWDIATTADVLYDAMTNNGAESAKDKLGPVLWSIKTTYDSNYNNLETSREAADEALKFANAALTAAGLPTYTANIANPGNPTQIPAPPPAGLAAGVPVPVGIPRGVDLAAQAAIDQLVTDRAHAVSGLNKIADAVGIALDVNPANIGNRADNVLAGVAALADLTPVLQTVDLAFVAAGVPPANAKLYVTEISNRLPAYQKAGADAEVRVHLDKIAGGSI
jgi:hypothetical protein